MDGARGSQKIVVLHSGGIDSSILVLKLLDEGWDVYPMFVNYGQVRVDEEWKACRIVTKALSLREPVKIDLESIIYLRKKLQPSRVEGFFFPYRNLLFSTMAAVYGHDLNSKAIGIGLIAEHPRHADTTENFCGKLESVLTESLGEIFRVVAPFVNKMKAEVVRYGLDRNFDFSLTYSCAEGNSIHCGECGSCISRKRAFEDNVSTDPTIYKIGTIRA